MSDQPLNALPNLASPGAGLPWLELNIARLGFRFLAGRTTREKSAALLEKERQAILTFLASCDEKTAAQRVLIKRLPGMEDSSRYWSVYMTLDHLRIVNLFVAETIRQLGKGKTPDRVASTAAVKPDPGVSVAVVAEFERSCAFVAHCADAIKDLKTAHRFAHPWFGPLDAAQWYFLAGFHMGLHRRQIEKILEKLGEPSALPA